MIIPEEERMRWKKFLRPKLRVAMLAVGISAAISGGLFLAKVWLWWPAVLLSIMTLVLGVVSIFLARSITLGEATKDNRHGRVDAQAVIDDLADGDPAITDEAIDAFVESIVVPSSVFSRISESGTVFENHTLRSTTYSVVQPPASSGGRVIVLHAKTRGEMMDGLKITEGKAGRISSLTHGENVRFIATALRRLAKRAGSLVYAEYVGSLEKRVIEIVGSQDSVDSSDLVSVSLELRKLQRNAQNVMPSLLLAACVQYLGVFNAVLVSVGGAPQQAGWRPQRFSWMASRAGRSATEELVHAPVRFTVEENLIVRSERPSLTDGFLQAIRGRIRPFGLVLFGLRDSVIFFPIANASRARSYHFQSDGPTNSFLVSQGLFRVSSELKYSLRPLEGQAFSHAYITDADGWDTASGYYQGRYHDSPPGSVGIAAIAAASALFALTVLAIQHLKWTDVSSGTLNTSLLLTLPSLLASYLGIGKSSEFLAGSVSSRIIALVSLMTTLTAVFITAVTPRAVSYSPGQFESDLATMGLATSFWLSLFAVQLTALLYAIGTWFYRTSVYFSLSNGRNIGHGSNEE